MLYFFEVFGDDVSFTVCVDVEFGFLWYVTGTKFEGFDAVLYGLDEEGFVLWVLGVDSPDEEVEFGGAAAGNLAKEEEFGFDVLVFAFTTGGAFGYVVTQVTEESENVSIKSSVIGVFSAVHDEAAAGFHADAVDFFEVFGGACLEVESAVGEFEAGSGFVVVAADPEFFHLFCEPVGVRGGKMFMYFSEHVEWGAGE
jgi:hypothetical protein